MEEYVSKELLYKMCEPSGIFRLHVSHVDQMPAADVVPVVHGKWIDEDFPEEKATVHGFAVCSACGELSHKAEHGYNILSKYCPSCSAKMDGGQP